MSRLRLKSGRVVHVTDNGEVWFLGTDADVDGEDIIELAELLKPLVRQKEKQTSHEGGELEPSKGSKG
jgi:hypothetical protein